MSVLDQTADGVTTLHSRAAQNLTHVFNVGRPCSERLTWPVHSSIARLRI